MIYNSKLFQFVYIHLYRTLKRCAFPESCAWGYLGHVHKSIVQQVDQRVIPYQVIQHNKDSSSDSDPHQN